MENNHPLGDFMSVTIEKIRELVDVNTVIGQPINTPDGITLIPVSKVSLGFATGGSDFQGKNASAQNPFGGGGGAGVKITPVAFLVIKDGNVRVVSLDQLANGTVDKLIDMLPEIIDRISAMRKKSDDPDIVE